MSHVEMQYVTYYNGHVIEVNGKRYALERTCRPTEPFDKETKHIVERGQTHYYWPYKGCSECGCDFPQGSNFCPNCGARVKEEA